MNKESIVVRDIHPDFRIYLDFKSPELIELYNGLRQFILGLCPDANELLYHTHALTSLYSVTDKMSDGFCMIPIYNNHLNLGFNMGTLLPDPASLLKGTGKLIRHIPIVGERDYDNAAVRNLIMSAFNFSFQDADTSNSVKALTISKIKHKKQ